MMIKFFLSMNFIVVVVVTVVDIVLIVAVFIIFSSSISLVYVWLRYTLLVWTVCIKFIASNHFLHQRSKVIHSDKWKIINYSYFCILWYYYTDLTYHSKSHNHHYGNIQLFYFLISVGEHWLVEGIFNLKNRAG